MAIDFKNFFKLIFPAETQKMYSIFTDQQIAELNELIKYQDYYDNDVFKYISLKNPEYKDQNASHLQYRPSQIPINYSRMIVNKLSSFQFTEPIAFQVLKGNGKIDNKLQGFMTGIHNDNNMNLKLMQASQEANKSGGVGIKNVYDTDKKQIRFLVRPRMETWVLTDIDDMEKILKVHFAFFLDTREKTVWKQTWELQTMTDGTKRVFLDEAVWDLTDVPKVVTRIFEGFIQVDGKFLDFLPVYVIANLPQANMIFGDSDLKDLIPIIDELNKKYSDSADALRFEMFAITILMNVNPAKQTDKEGGFALKTKPGAMWNLAGGSPTSNLKPAVSRLESNFSYVESLKQHIGNLKSLIFEISNVVQLDDKLGTLGNISGVALKLLFANMAIKTNNKNTIWEPDLEKIYLDMLKLKGLHEKFKVPDDTKVDIQISSPVPQNEVEAMQVLTAQLSQNLISTERAMKEIGIVDTVAEMAKILEEGKADDEILKDIMNQT